MNKVIFNEIQALKRQLTPAEKMILFGSRACGDARNWETRTSTLKINVEQEGIEIN